MSVRCPIANNNTVWEFVNGVRKYIPVERQGCGNAGCPHHRLHKPITRNARGLKHNRCSDPCPRFPDAGPCRPIAAKKTEGEG